VLGIVNSEIVKVTDENVQKKIDINTEVLGRVDSQIIKVTDENVQKDTVCVDIYFFLNTLICYF
jgi:hypothetical protein